MGDLISREALFRVWDAIPRDEDPNLIIDEMIKATQDAPAVDAVEVVRYTPPIKPMTLEEVWKEEDPVWVEGKNGALYIGDFYASMSAKNGWDVQTLGSAKPQLILEDYYGKTWRCWSGKPTDEERSAAEWKKD